MTREGAKKEVLRLVFGDAAGVNYISDDDVLSIIDKIYDYFESRTCSNCKYSYTKNISKLGMVHWCKKLDMSISDDFYCKYYKETQNETH
jgi:hypothetical protein